MKPSLVSRLLLATLCLLFAVGVGATRPGQDATSVLTRMRAALGGEAVLDAVRTFSLDGSITLNSGNFKSSFELLAILPDHFMTIRRHYQDGGPIPLSFTYYNGFRGSELINHTDASIPLPPDPGPQTPDAIARRRAANLLQQQRFFARLVLILVGKPVASYPLEFSYAGRETVDERPTDVVEARATDGYTLRLHVDAATHLPMFVSWQEGAPVFMKQLISTSRVVVTRGGQVISQTQTPPITGPPPSDPASISAPLVTWRVVATDFRTKNGLNWPRRIQVRFDREVTQDMRLGSHRINPKLDPRRFSVGR